MMREYEWKEEEGLCVLKPVNSEERINYANILLKIGDWECIMPNVIVPCEEKFLSIEEITQYFVEFLKMPGDMIESTQCSNPKSIVIMEKNAVRILPDFSMYEEYYKEAEKRVNGISFVLTKAATEEELGLTGDEMYPVNTSFDIVAKEDNLKIKVGHEEQDINIWVTTKLLFVVTPPEGEKEIRKIQMSESELWQLVLQTIRSTDSSIFLSDNF